MDEFMEYLTSKISKVMMVFIGVIVPGVLFLFIYERDIFMELDILKLLLLSCSISIPTYALLVAKEVIGDLIKINILNVKKYTDIEDLLIDPLLSNALFFILYIGFDQLLRMWKINRWDTRRLVVNMFLGILLMSVYSLIFYTFKIIKKKARDRKAREQIEGKKIKKKK